MARKKKQTTKKTTSKRKTPRKKKEESLFWAISGIVLLAISGLAFSHFGWLGAQTANLLRLFFGDAYLLASALFVLFGAIMLIYNQPPHFGFKRNSGLVMALLAILVLLAAHFFAKEKVHANFTNAFWFAMSEEFGRASVTESVGGGLLGSVIYGIFYPILGQTGSLVITWAGLVVGILMFFDVKFKTLLHRFQFISQLFIAKNKAAGSKLKENLSEYAHEHKPSVTAHFKKDMEFPDTDDFSSKKAEEQPEVPVENTNEPAEPEPEPAPLPSDIPPEPEIQLPPEPEPLPEENINHDQDKLPKSHSFQADDAKLMQALGEVDHGELASAKVVKNYKKPPIDLLAPIPKSDQGDDKALIRKNTEILQKTFKSFGVEVIIKRAILGPTITRYEVQPAVGVKVSRIVNLADDLALALAAKDIRIEAPIPGKPYIGIEVPNRNTSVVSFRDVMIHQDKKSHQDPMTVPLGKDVSGSVVSANLTKMPHLLIAGSTGSGKSVAINTILTSILMKARPEEVKLVLIDPKMVELSVYNGVPHLLIPVVTDSKLAANALHKAVKEMERRYKLFAAGGVRNMEEYNRKAKANNENKDQPVMPILPYILVVVDELSDLMMVGGHDVEGAIVRLGQMARAAGIHMILATQRPSVDVITGLIKANVPSRISFAVSSGVDSRTILDQTGAEKLLGRGDMLYMPIGASKPERIQGAYISSDEVEQVIAWVKDQQEATYDEEMIPQETSENDQAGGESDDEYYDQAVDLVRRQQAASVSMLQRRFRIGYNRAARIVDEMEAKGVVGPSEGSKPRQVLLPPPDDERNNG